MGVTRPQVPLLVSLKVNSGTDKATHRLLQPSSMAATDLLLDLPLQLEPMDPYLIHTKLKRKGVVN